MSWTSLDTWIVAAAVSSAVACALPGNFLVLRRMSLMGDAISHSVLPGLAIAFLVSGSRSSWPMFVGAAVAGVLTAVIAEFIYNYAKVEEQASLGTVFSLFFAIGLVLIVQAANNVDLDPSCVLYGAVELTPLDTIKVFGFMLPRAVAVLSVTVLANGLIIVLLFKELSITSFDPALAKSLGIPSRLFHYLLMIMTAVTAVAAFETVGSILVVAMLVVPAATAYLFTNKLSIMVISSTVVAAVTGIAGHLFAITVPPLFGFSDTNTAGSMAVVSGFLFALAVVFSPKGIIKTLQNRKAVAEEMT
jgi:manganese/zinc/iron transport system permease protein